MQKDTHTIFLFLQSTYFSDWKLYPEIINHGTRALATPSAANPPAHARMNTLDIGLAPTGCMPLCLEEACTKYALSPRHTVVPITRHVRQDFSESLGIDVYLYLSKKLCKPYFFFPLSRASLAFFMAASSAFFFFKNSISSSS